MLTAWIDIDPQKIGNHLEGVPVYDYPWLADQSPRPFVLNYVNNHGAREKIAAALESLGFRPGHDYLSVG